MKARTLTFTNRKSLKEEEQVLVEQFLKILPATTVTGHCGPMSRHSLCPVCPAELSLVPKWTCPCWESWRCLRQWSDSLVYVLISSPEALNSLQENEKGSMRKIIYYPGSFLRSFWIGKRRLSIMIFISPKRKHLNSKKAIIRNKSGTKSKNKIANSGYFVWIYFGKIENKADNSSYFSVIDDFAKWKQGWNALSCLITDSLMTTPWFSSFIVSLKKNIFSQSIFAFLLFASIILQMKIPSVQSYFHKPLQWCISNWTVFCFLRDVC